jgi:hypothetical protein
MEVKGSNTSGFSVRITQIERVQTQKHRGFTVNVPPKTTSTVQHFGGTSGKSAELDGLNCLEQSRQSSRESSIHKFFPSKAVDSTLLIFSGPPTYRPLAHEPMGSQ